MTVDDLAEAYAVHTSGAIHSAEEPIQTAGLIAPTARTGLVATLGTDLHGPGVTVADALSAIGAMTCAIEITDSRDGNEGPTAKSDLVADNLSIVRLVLGPVLRPVADLDLALVGLLWEHEGTLLTTASGAAAPGGHPAAALAALANHLTDRDGVLQAGSLVYTGSLVPPVRLTPGTEVRATYAYFGSVGVRTR